LVWFESGFVIVGFVMFVRTVFGFGGFICFFLMSFLMIFVDDLKALWIFQN